MTDYMLGLTWAWSRRSIRGGCTRYYLVESAKLMRFHARRRRYLRSDR